MTQPGDRGERSSSHTTVAVSCASFESALLQLLSSSSVLFWLIDTTSAELPALRCRKGNEGNATTSTPTRDVRARGEFAVHEAAETREGGAHRELSVARCSTARCSGEEEQEGE